LQDLNNVDDLETNNAIILQRCEDVKRMLKDYQGALEDLDKADVIDQTMHSLCEPVEMSKRF